MNQLVQPVHYSQIDNSIITSIFTLTNLANLVRREEFGAGQFTSPSKIQTIFICLAFLANTKKHEANWHFNLVIVSTKKQNQFTRRPGLWIAGRAAGLQQCLLQWLMQQPHSPLLQTWWVPWAAWPFFISC